MSNQKTKESRQRKVENEMKHDKRRITVKLNKMGGETSKEYLTYQLDGRIGAYHGVDG